MTPSSSATTLGRLSSASTPKNSSAGDDEADPLARAQGVGVDGSSATAVRTANMRVPTVSSTTRVRVGRKVTGRVGSSAAVVLGAVLRLVAAGSADGHRRQAWMPVVRMARAPRSYRSSMMRWASRGGDHGADGDPALVVQRGDGRRLQARGEGDGLLQVLDAES